MAENKPKPKAGPNEGVADKKKKRVKKSVETYNIVFNELCKTGNILSLLVLSKQKEFVHKSNEKYVSAPSTSCVHSDGHSTYCRHADLIFISNDLEDYASNANELKLKFQKESLVLFLLDNTRADRIFLKSLHTLLDTANQGKWLQNLQYAVFGLHPIDEKIDDLHNHGASCFNKTVIDDGDEGAFSKWQKTIWTKLDEYGVEKGLKTCKRRNFRGGPSKASK